MSSKISSFSPQYIGASKTTPEQMLRRVEAMKIINPKLKLLVNVCDPIKEKIKLFSNKFINSS